MADQVANTHTSMSTEEVIAKAVQYFSTGKWQPTGQSARTATFRGMPPLPWGLIILTLAGLIACVVPGIILYILLVKKARQFQNMEVTASPISGGTEVVVTSPPWASKLVSGFLGSLPPLEGNSGS